MSQTHRVKADQLESVKENYFQEARKNSKLIQNDNLE